MSTATYVRSKKREKKIRKKGIEQHANEAERKSHWIL
jgi:hypothetical protein